jgi:hypothetical protein
MKGFATFTLVLSIIGVVLGFLVMVAGNSAESMSGAAVLGGAFSGVLLSCLVMVAVDIRDTLKLRDLLSAEEEATS